MSTYSTPEISYTPTVMPSRSEVHNTLGVFEFPDDNITIISQPTIADTLAAVREQPAHGTTILTPELSLLETKELRNFTPEYQRHPETVRRIGERVSQLLDLSKETNNTILAGVPLASSKSGMQSNGLIATRHGAIIRQQHKVSPSLYELKVNHFCYNTPANRYHEMGRTAMICSELIFAGMLDSRLRQDTTDVLMPAAWSVPTISPETAATFPTLDAYYQDALTESVAWSTQFFPNLNHVYVADRPLDAKPQNGRFSVRHENTI